MVLADSRDCQNSCESLEHRDTATESIKTINFVQSQTTGGHVCRVMSLNTKYCSFPVRVRDGLNKGQASPCYIVQFDVQRNDASGERENHIPKQFPSAIPELAISAATWQMAYVIQSAEAFVLDFSARSESGLLN